MHKRYIVKLDKEERKQLAELVKKEKVAAKKRTHAQVLLLADCSRHGPAWKDEAIAEADTILLTIPNQLGVEYNVHVMEAILKHVAPDLGWR